MAQPSDLDQLKEFLTVGPFGGLDPTTNPYYVAPQNFVDGQNFVPNHGYGGFVTVMGRTIALASPLPGPCYGMHVLTQEGQPDTYIFEVDVGTVLDPLGKDDPTGLVAPLAVANPSKSPPYGTLWYAQLGQHPINLMLPNNEALPPATQVFFTDCQSWVFVTNGVSRPLKIDTSLNVTYWGIIAPTAAPKIRLSGAGPLLGQYYYAITWGVAGPQPPLTQTPATTISSNSLQESSQGVISQVVTCAHASAMGSKLQITGNPQPGDVITVFVGSIGQPTYAVDYTVPSPRPPGGLRGMAQAVMANFNLDPYVTQYATAGAPANPDAPLGQIVLTAAQPGAAGNQIFYYGKMTQGTNGDFGPHTTQLLSGGVDGNSVELTFPDPHFDPGDPQVNQMNIYRLGGSLGTWNLIATLNKPFPSKYYDTLPDSDVVGQQLIVFRDPPPPFSYIATHMERVWGFGIQNNYNPTPQYNITADPSVVWWSNINEPWGFNSATSNFTCGDNKFSDVAVGLMELGGVLLAVKSRRGYFIYGSTDADFQPIFAWFVGCNAPLSIATGYGVGFWLGRQGVHMTDGYSKNQISDALFRQSNVKNILDGLSDADYAAAVGFVYDRQYYLSFPTQDFTLLYDMRDQQWYKLGFSCPQALYDLESDAPVVAMDNKVRGQVDQWFNSPCDLTGVVTATLRSRISDGGIKQGTKRLERALVLAPIQDGVCAKVTIISDPGGDTETRTTTPVLLGDGYQRHEWGLSAPGGGTMDCYTMALELCVDGPAIIDSVALYGWLVRVHDLGGPRTDFETQRVGP